MSRNLILVLLLLLSFQAWATNYHVCPSKSATNGALTYGSGDGSSQANCYAGAAAAFAGAITSGDTLYVHGTFYHEKFYVSKSGTSGSPITIDFSDALMFETVDMSGSNTANSSAAQTTGSSWQLVSGTTGIYKKGVGFQPYALWVDGVRKDHSAQVPAGTTDADAIAVLQPGQFTSVIATLDTLADTVYYYGSPTSNMRTNGRQSAAYVTNANCSICLNGVSYITLVNPSVRGFIPVSVEQGGLFIQDTTGVTVTNPTLWENTTGMKLGANTNLTINGGSIHDNDGIGVALSGQSTLDASGTIDQITAITKANPGRVTTSAAHGLSNGQKVAMTSVGGMTQITSTTEYTVTVVDPNNFTIGVDTSAFSAFTTHGVLHRQKTDTNSTFNNINTYNNGGYARYNGINLTFNQDSDGFGVGYYGGTVVNPVWRGGNYYNNGPRRALITGEGGDITRGSGLYMGTSFTMDIQNAVVSGIYFYGNHRLNLNLEDATSFKVTGNTFNGVVGYSAAAAAFGQARIVGTAGANTYYFANNTFNGESESYGLSVNNAASNSHVVANNLFGDLTKSTNAAAWSGSLTVVNNTATYTEKFNKFLTAPSSNFYKLASTQYTTVSAWQGASSQGTSDEIISSAGWIGGFIPSSEAGFALKPASVLRRAGFDINIGNALDAIGRPFSHPPSIGSYEVTSGQEITSRTNATTRSARN
jgi:hypothetical protein